MANTKDKHFMDHSLTGLIWKHRKRKRLNNSVLKLYPLSEIANSGASVTNRDNGL
jgi:hypothetical protein